MARGPPSAESVLEQKADHVRLGEELCNGREVSAADLPPAVVDLLFLLALPVLIDPAERVVCDEDLAGEAAEDCLKRLPALRRQLDSQARIVGSEDAGQHLPGEASG